VQHSALIFGCGYLGLRVARRWRACGRCVTAVTRTPKRAEALQAEGLEAIIADITRPGALQHLPPAATVLFAVGFDRSAGQSIRDVYVTGLRLVLDALPDSVERFLYISSTGVYSQTGDVWVDEDSVAGPEREGGRACLEAEQLLAAHPIGRRSIVLRMAGLYGPGRVPRVRELESGQPIAAPSAGNLNLIHVEDAASVVIAAEQSAPLPRLYLVSDGHPVQRRTYYEELARLLGAPVPSFTTTDADSPAARRAESSKRIRNDRLRRELGVTLRYASYREGLAAILGDR
jgi:nucleoside-diphosphate-sugar epimerase